MNAGSLLRAEMARTTSSLRPGGSVSDSMSVTNPCWYSLLISPSIELPISPFPENACELVHGTAWALRFNERAKQIKLVGFPGERLGPRPSEEDLGQRQE